MNITEISWLITLLLFLFLVITGFIFWFTPKANSINSFLKLFGFLFTASLFFSLVVTLA